MVKGNKSVRIWFDVIFLGIIIVLSCTLALNLAQKKPGKMLDEYFCFGLANSTYETNQGKYDIYLPQGVAEEPKPFFDRYFYASSFSIEDVWKNQSYDVHPPFFYLIIHVLGRLTHNQFGFRIGIYFNIFLLIANILLIYTLLRLLTEERKWAYYGVIWYSFLSMILQHAIYIRMYYLLSTLFLVLVLWLCIGYKYPDIRRKFIVIFYLGLGLQSIFGVLTHYYYVIFLFFACVFWFFLLLIPKKWKELVMFVVTMLGAGIASYLIFPAMKYHIFSGNRGQESMDSLLHSNFVDFLLYYGKILVGLLGHWIMPVGVAAFALAYVIRSVQANCEKRIDGDDISRKQYGIVLFPTLLYYVCISKIGIISSSRFIAPVFAVAIVSFVLLLHVMQKKMFVRCVFGKETFFVFCCVLLMVTIGSSWKNFSWNDLSLDQTRPLELAKEYGPDNDCFYIWELSEDSMVCYDEFCQYNTIYFWNKDTTVDEMQDVLMTYDHLVVYFNCIGQLNKEKQEELLGEMIAQNDKLEQYQLLYENSMNCAYYLE